MTGMAPGSLSTTVLGVIRPTSLETAFTIDAPGEFEVHEVLVTGVRTFRDDAKGAERGPNTSFVFELDGLQAIHLGDVGHVLTEQMLGEIGSVQVALRARRRRAIARPRRGAGRWSGRQSRHPHAAR